MLWIAYNKINGFPSLKLLIWPYVNFLYSILKMVQFWFDEIWEKRFNPLPSLEPLTRSSRKTRVLKITIRKNLAYQLHESFLWSIFKIKTSAVAQQKIQSSYLPRNCLLHQCILQTRQLFNAAFFRFYLFVIGK